MVAVNATCSFLSACFVRFFQYIVFFRAVLTFLFSAGSLFRHCAPDENRNLYLKKKV